MSTGGSAQPHATVLGRMRWERRRRRLGAGSRVTTAAAGSGRVDPSGGGSGGDGAVTASGDCLLFSFIRVFPNLAVQAWDFDGEKTNGANVLRTLNMTDFKEENSKAKPPSPFASCIASIGRNGSGVGNLVFSPLSIHAALALVAAGACGRTLDELLAVLDEFFGSASAGRALADRSASGGPRVVRRRAPLAYRAAVVDDYKATVSTADL
uniref:Serpin domain-containing protein n=1 Tax=Leersia perrieri TaxID=77586 RepID=A0A0D9XQK3_9ORYZ